MKFGRFGSILGSSSTSKGAVNSTQQVRRSFLSPSFFMSKSKIERRRIEALKDSYQQADNLRPFFQSATDPNIPIAEPPKQVGRLLQTSLSTSTNMIDIVREASSLRVQGIRKSVSHILNNVTPDQYAQHCDTYLDVRTVKENDVKGHEGLSNIVDQDGVFAKQDIPKGTVFIYAGKYLSMAEVGAIQSEIGEHNLQSYSWTPKASVIVSGFNAGNITKKVNCYTDETGWPDPSGNNMAMYAFETEDPRHPVVCYVAHKDIKAEEQLFVNYGEQYNFR